MSPQIARNALVFLSRCDIKGGEAPAFMEVFQAIRRYAEPQEAQLELPARGPREVVSNE